MNLNKDYDYIQLRCKECKQRLMDYTFVGEDDRIVLQNITMKCCRCKRVLMLKKYTEGMLRQHSVNGMCRI